MKFIRLLRGAGTLFLLRFFSDLMSILDDKLERGVELCNANAYSKAESTSIHHNSITE